MACERWEETLVAALYDEIEPDRKQALESHLETCPGCRESFEELAAARTALRRAEPRLPNAPPVVLLDAPRRWGWRWTSFAAGFACASVLLAAGVLAGMRLAAAPAAGTPPEPTTADAGASVPAAVASRLDALERELRARQDSRLAAAVEEMRDQSVTPGQLDTRLASFEGSLDRRRREDVRLLLGEILAAEVRSGAAISETQKALRYVAAANRPGMSEW